MRVGACADQRPCPNRMDPGHPRHVIWARWRGRRLALRMVEQSQDVVQAVRHHQPEGEGLQLFGGQRGQAGLNGTREGAKALRQLGGQQTALPFFAPFLSSAVLGLSG